MSDRHAKVPFKKIAAPRIFKNKNVLIEGELLALPGKLPAKGGCKSYVMVRDIKNTTKKILVCVPDNLKGKIETGRDYVFSGKLNSQKGSSFAATLTLDKLPSIENENKH
jgi:hypothetical protein